MDSSFKNRIILKMSPINFSSGNGWPTEQAWDNYLNQNLQFLNHSGDFISYTENADEVFIKDFISDNTENSVALWRELLRLSEGRRIAGKIHTANYKLLETAIRIGFKITDFDGVQYLVEKGE